MCNFEKYIEVCIIDIYLVRQLVAVAAEILLEPPPPAPESLAARTSFKTFELLTVEQSVKIRELLFQQL